MKEANYSINSENSSSFEEAVNEFSKPHSTMAGITPAKFENSFWNEDVGNFQGWDLITRRMKDGRQILKEYSEFLKQRAMIEEQLGKALVKLAKTFNIKEEIEPVRGVWEVLKSQTETSGLNHLKSSHQFFAELSKMTEIAETCREKRRAREDAVRSHQQNLKLQWKRLMESKRIYETRCREEVACNQFYHQEISRLGKSSKEAEKAHTKYVKARQALDVSESNYQSSVSSVEETRMAWEKETERSLAVFQSLEEERLSSTRDSQWRIANIQSASSVSNDCAAEQIRRSLETCNLEDALARFISGNATGSKRPPNIIFKQQPTSSSLGMGKASHEGGSQDIRIPTSSSNPLNVSHTPNGHDSRANQVSNFSSTHALNLPSSNSQGFQKANSSSFFDTQSLNSAASNNVGQNQSRTTTPNYMNYGVTGSADVSSPINGQHSAYNAPNHHHGSLFNPPNGSLSLSSLHEFGSMSQNPMPFSGHQTPNPTASHFRGGGGVSKRLYNTSTQPRNISHHNTSHNRPPYFERRQNLIDDMGLEISSYNNSISRSFNNDSNPIIDGRATSASQRISSNHQFHSNSEQATSNHGQGIYSIAPPPPPPPPPPPAVRPKKPPRLLQYAQQTLNRHSINVALNTSIKTSQEKTDTSVTTPPAAIPHRTSNGPLQGGSNFLLTSNAVDNNEYFNLGDDTTSGESGSYGPGSSPDRQSRSPPSTSDYQSDLSTNGIASGNRVIGGDSGHYSSFHSTSSFGSTSNSKGTKSELVQSKVTGKFYERGKAPAPPPPSSSSLSNGLSNQVNSVNTHSDAINNPKAVVVYNYIKKDNEEMSLGKSQIVTVLESKRGSEWWKVQDSIGRQGYYPSHYLKMI